MTEANSPSDGFPPERRSSKRHPPKVEPTYVWVSLDTRLRAKVIDESPGGIAIQVEGENDGHFDVGFQVRVQHDETRKTAMIVYVSDPKDGVYRVGLSWDV